MSLLKITKPFERWSQEDLPGIYEQLRKKERAPDPGPEHLERPCQCDAGWELFMTADELMMLKCKNCEQWWLPMSPDARVLPAN